MSYELYTKIENVVSEHPVGKLTIKGAVSKGQFIRFAKKTYEIIAVRYNVINQIDTVPQILMTEVKEKWGIV